MYKVLIAEDEQKAREGFAKIIPWEDYGFTVAGTAGDGAQALEICRRQQIHLLMTDIRMPVMDGLELVTKVKADSPLTAILLVSAYREFEYAHRALEMGVEYYLLKPVEEIKLICALGSIKRALSCALPADGGGEASCGLPASIKDLIAREYGDENLGVGYISRKLAYNASYLGRAFLASEGISIRAYIKNYRIREACRLLLNGSMKIAEVAYATGFHDLGTFYESFRDCMNCTPIEYKKDRH